MSKIQRNFVYTVKGGFIINNLIGVIVVILLLSHAMKKVYGVGRTVLVEKCAGRMMGGQ